MMKLELDPNTSSKDSAAEECEGAAKGSSDAGGKVGTKLISNLLHHAVLLRQRPASVSVSLAIKYLYSIAFSYA